MKTVGQLLASHCREMRGPAMGDSEISAQLSVLDGWTFAGDAITKTYRFKNYYETLAFVNALAWMIHREDHHPDLRVGYSQCEVRYSTHSVNGISENDFISAAKADAIFSNEYPAT